jgi:hypothetical protein
MVPLDSDCLQGKTNSFDCKTDSTCVPTEHTLAPDGKSRSLSRVRQQTNTKVKCEICNIDLCLELYFKIYHTKLHFWSSSVWESPEYTNVTNYAITDFIPKVWKWKWILLKHSWDKQGRLWSSFCYVFDFFQVKTSTEVQLGDNYEYYKNSSILRGCLGEKMYYIYMKNWIKNQSQTISKESRIILDTQREQ